MFRLSLRPLRLVHENEKATLIIVCQLAHAYDRIRESKKRDSACQNWHENGYENGRAIECNG